MNARSLLGLLGVAYVSTACALPEESPRQARSTLVIGIDVSGSFRSHYDDAIDFASHYLYGHLNGFGELHVPSAVFVGSVGGGEPGEAKSFQPIHAFQGKSVEEIATLLRELYPIEDSFTDFNVFFDRVATLVKRQNLILAPLSVVLLSDGVPDVTAAAAAAAEQPYATVDLDPLEYLSRNVTVRLLYASPTVAVDWEREVDRQRVRIWTVDADVMRGWREQMLGSTELRDQISLWTWVGDNVDFRVRTRRL